MIRVVVADDQELVRAGLRSLLENDPDITVTGEAADGRSAVEQVRRHRPDVVLMDLRMPGGGGLGAIAEITADRALTGVRVLVLTTFEEPDEIDAAVRAGAAGYLLKDTGSADLRRAVHTVAGGGGQLSPSVARHVMRRAAAPRPPLERHPGLDSLTERERAVLARVGLGESNQEIAAALFLSPATARTYVSRLITKLAVRDRTQLAVIAHRAGLES